LFAARLTTCVAILAALTVTAVVAFLHADFSAAVVYGALQSFASVAL